jgi:sulfite reductase (ferredoxin)
MESFRTELENIENPVVQRDIIDLEKKIRLFREGKIDDDKFRSLRLARGIYGQRQPGVQMVRIKLPFGRITTKQIRRIADISDEFASSNLHATTRQDIQIHFVSLDKTPQLWAKLEQDDITTREACGNTVRNITASATAGIDPNELFDVSPYAYEMYQYFLRNPICQEMGRKMKFAFSNNETDTAYTFIHDIGFIPRIVHGKRGFKVLVGGGLGATPVLAFTAYEFLDEDKIIPFAEAVLRVFDRYGERTRRMKARLKFLIEDIGPEKFMELVEEEKTALKNHTYKIDQDILPDPELPEFVPYHELALPSENRYARWHKSNVITQKQEGYFAVYVRLPLGSLSSAKARQFADVVDTYASNELRITINQGYLIRFVRPEALRHLYNSLDQLGLAEPGFDSVADVTACPGTESCNLGISSSTGIALALEKVMEEEYPDLIYNSDIKIKISGCPNSCGQHGLASIGYYGSTIKDKSGNIMPALVVLLGGGKLKDGNGIISDKIVKIPSKRGPDSLRILLNDYEANASEGEYYHDYFKRMGDKHFYALLKPLAEMSTLVQEDYIDWGEEHKFKLQTAVGECAGVIIDLIATLFYESQEKLDLAKSTLLNGHYADSIYHSYSAFINTAKALLLSQDVKPSTQHQVMTDFQKIFVEGGLIDIGSNSFREYVLRINKNEPSEEFARRFAADSSAFLEQAFDWRKVNKVAV